MKPEQTQPTSPQPTGIPYTPPPQAQNPITAPIGQQVDPTEKANQAKANLGFVNTLQEHLLQHHTSKQASEQKPQDSQPQEEEPNKLEDMESRIVDEISKVKKSIEENTPKDKNKELEDLKKEIEDVLNSDNEE